VVPPGWSQASDSREFLLGALFTEAPDDRGRSPRALPAASDQGEHRAVPFVSENDMMAECLSGLAAIISCLASRVGERTHSALPISPPQQTFLAGPLGCSW